MAVKHCTSPLLQRLEQEAAKAHLIEDMWLALFLGSIAGVFLGMGV